MSFQDRITDFSSKLSNLSQEYLNSLDDDDFDEKLDGRKSRYIELMRGIVDVVDEAQKENTDDLQEVLKKAESALGKAVMLAYAGDGDSDMFQSLPSYAHSDERPSLKIKHEEGQFSQKTLKLGAMFMEMMKGMGLPGLDPNAFARLKPPAPWKDVVRPHPLSTRCARFMDEIPEATIPSPEKEPSALSIFQARAEVTYGDIQLPIGIHASASGRGIIVPGMGGWKQRSPFISVFCPNTEPSDSVDGKMELLGLAHIAYHGAIDDETGLFFVADEDRIKSYSWWDTTKDAPQKQLIPEHTMNSSGFHGPLALLSNRRLARVGRKGKIGIWNLDDLPTHSTAKKGIIGGSMCKRGEEISTSRDDPEDIEVSAGSKPTSTITVADPFAIDIWHAHPNTSGSMITATDGRSLQYHCRAFDIEQAQCTTRYLGHGGGINQISTSRGDSNVFCTAGTDGFARLYDVRVPLPTITVEAAACQTNCGAAVVCHPDGIPYMFVSDKEAECITLWDIRAKAPVYDLATGNNVVDGLVWNDERNELFAATTCNYVDRNGYHHGYEQARIPRQETEEDAAKDSEGNEDDWVDDDDDEDEEDDEDRWEDTDQCWPGNAYHSETYFGHTFDSGDHRIYRYAFKADPDPLIIPADGGATMDEEGSYW